MDDTTSSGGATRCRECRDDLARYSERVMGICFRCLAARRRRVVGVKRRSAQAVA